MAEQHDYSKVYTDDSKATELTEDDADQLNDVLGNSGIEMSNLTTKEQLESTLDADDESTEMSGQDGKGRHDKDGK